METKYTSSSDSDWFVGLSHYQKHNMYRIEECIYFPLTMVNMAVGRYCNSVSGYQST